MTPDAFERLRERLAHVDADQGWFFARIADQVADQRKALGLSQKELAELTGDDAVGDRPARVRRAAAADRHAAPHRRGARLRADRRAGPTNATKGSRNEHTLDVEEIQTTKGEKLLAVVLPSSC